MHVHQIWTYPVKTMQGLTVESAELHGLGIVGDRQWALRDLTTGNLANARQTPGLMSLAAHPRGSHISITIDGRQAATSSDGDVDAVLSDALGRPVRLERVAAAHDLDAFRRRPPTEPMSDPIGHLRGIFGREGDEPLPDFSKFGPHVMEFDSPPGAFHDCFPLMVMSTSALRSMAAALPGSVVDVRRFRPSFVVDTGDEPGHPEFSWAGRRFALGTAVIEVVNDCPRCVAITKQVGPDIPADREVLRHVVRDLGQAVGVYCNVLQPGTFSVGDTFSPVS